MTARVTVVTRADCHLCDVAEDAVARIAAEAGVGWSAVDVDADPALLAEYSDLVPVILVDGRMHGYWRVEEDRLRAALARPPRPRKVDRWLISSGTERHAARSCF